VIHKFEKPKTEKSAERRPVAGPSRPPPASAENVEEFDDDDDDDDDFIGPPIPTSLQPAAGKNIKFFLRLQAFCPFSCFL
jgi:hypothetical protein